MDLTIARNFLCCSVRRNDLTSITICSPYSLMPSGSALKNAPNFPKTTLFSSKILIFGVGVISTDWKTQTFKLIGHGQRVVFTFTEILFSSPMDTRQYSIFWFP